MTSKTPNNAKVDWICPLVRYDMVRCIADDCAAWRWVPLASGILTDAVAARIAETGGGPVNHKKAVAWVMERRAELGIPTEPTHGYCGLAGPL